MEDYILQWFYATFGREADQTNSEDMKIIRAFEDGRNTKYIHNLSDDEIKEYALMTSHEWWEQAMNRFNELSENEKAKYNQFIGFNDVSDLILNEIVRACRQIRNSGTLTYEKGNIEKCDATGNETLKVDIAKAHEVISANGSNPSGPEMDEKTMKAVEGWRKQCSQNDGDTEVKMFHEGKDEDEEQEDIANKPEAKPEAKPEVKTEVKTEGAYDGTVPDPYKVTDIDKFRVIESQDEELDDNRQGNLFAVNLTRKKPSIRKMFQFNKDKNKMKPVSELSFIKDYIKRHNK